MRGDRASRNCLTVAFVCDRLIQPSATLYHRVVPFVTVVLGDDVVEVYLGVRGEVAVWAYLAKVRGAWELVGLSTFTLTPNDREDQTHRLRFDMNEWRPVGSGSPRPVSSDDLRSLSLPAIRREAHQSLIREVALASLAVESDELAHVLSTAAQEWSDSMKATGRPDLDDEFFVRVALRYNQAWESSPDKPTDEVWRWLADIGRPCSKATAARYVSRARNEFGFLHKTTERKPNGRLTAKARRLLEQLDNNEEG